MLMSRSASFVVSSIYNKKGECLIPNDMDFSYYSIRGETDLKYINCEANEKRTGKEIEAAYDLDGKVVIPKNLEYVDIYYSEGYWHCEDASENEVTYSKDLKYVADGIMQFYPMAPWGYSMPYFFSAVNGRNPSYVLYLEKFNLSISQTAKVFETMRERNVGITYDTAMCDEIVKEIKGLNE